MTVTAATPRARLPTAVTARGNFSVGCVAVSLVAWVGSVSAQRLSCPPQIWSQGAGPPMGRGLCAVGRDGANVGVAAAVVRALGVYVNVMMPAASDTRASSVEALAAASVEYVSVKPTAQGEHVSAVGKRTTVLVPKTASAVDTDIANVTAASAWMATMVPCATSAQAVRHHVKSIGTVQNVGPLGLVPWLPTAAWLVPMPT